MSGPFRTVFERRATGILFNFLQAVDPAGVFLMPGNVCTVVPLAFLKARRPFELVDLSPATLAVDEAQVLDRLVRRPERYAGVIMVRPYGAMRATEKFFRRLKRVKPDLLIVDDRCLASPQFTRPSGSAADLILYSTGYAKVVDVGWGGFGFLRRDLPYARATAAYAPQALARLERRCKAKVSAQARLRYRDSAWLDLAPPAERWESYRRQVTARLGPALRQTAELNAIYAAGLPRRVQLARAFQGWRFNVRVPRKDVLLERIFAEGLFASSHYAPLGGVFGDAHLPVATALHAEVVNLFNDFHVTAEDARQLVCIVRAHLQRFPASGGA